MQVPGEKGRKQWRNLLISIFSKFKEKGDDK
jgi:hypothetical protein